MARPIRLVTLALAILPLAAGCRSSSRDVRCGNARAPSEAPSGYVEMSVAGLVPQGVTHALVLADGRETWLPIYIGPAEAMSIDLRRAGRRYPRPLTHDLLDTTMRALGGHLARVQVDELRAGTYIGSVFVRRGDKVLRLDARPSDAIALALGNRVPIWVARTVLDAAGVRYDPTQPERARAIRF